MKYTKETFPFPIGEAIVHSSDIPAARIGMYVDMLKELDDTGNFTELVTASEHMLGVLHGSVNHWCGLTETGETMLSIILETLAATLDLYAPEGVCFGRHPRDMTKIGYWEAAK